MATETVENYVKSIYTLRDAERDGGRVALGDLAGAVGVTPGTATTMVKRLAKEKLARYERYRGVALTAKGEKMALAVLRRHRLIETFLVRTLGMDWSEVHEEAEKLEHALSDRLLVKLDEFLGHPAVDPHGDPIPDGDGRLREAALVAVARCKPGARVRLARVLDQRADFLRFLDRHRIRIGVMLRLARAEPGAGTVTVEVDGREVTIGEASAANLMVEAVGR